jgi:hypothetical protein
MVKKARWNMDSKETTRRPFRSTSAAIDVGKVSGMEEAMEMEQAVDNEQHN